MIVLESTKNHAIEEETDICPTLPAAMGMGGGHVPMVVSHAKALSWDGRETFPNLTTRTINQLMPDKANFGCILVYDARGNGKGTISPTITGDHQNRITDYTAIVVGCKYKKENDYEDV